MFRRNTVIFLHFLYNYIFIPLFVIYLFRIPYFAYVYFAFYYLYLVISQSLICYLFNYNSLLFGDFKICRQKNPRFRGGLVVCYEDYYEGGILLTSPFRKLQRTSIFIWGGKRRLWYLLPLAAMLIKFTQLLYWIHGERVTLLSYINTIRCISHTII